MFYMTFVRNFVLHILQKLFYIIYYTDIYQYNIFKFLYLNYNNIFCVHLLINHKTKHHGNKIQSRRHGYIENRKP